MTSLLWSAFGMTVGAAVLHGALGLRRPIERTYLSFACIMVLLAAFIYFSSEQYRALDPEDAVEAIRRQLVAAHAFLGCILIFVPVYTKVRIPRLVMAILWGGLALLFLANLWLPYGIWYSTQPELVTATFRGMPYTAVIAQPMELPQYLHAIYVLGLFGMTFVCAMRVMSRGDRLRGAILAGSVILVVVLHVTDLVRDAIGGTWPYVSEFGVVTWGLLMSIQLAIDFRNSEQRLSATLRRVEQDRAELAAILDTTLYVRDKLNTPLQTLELGLAMRTASETSRATALAALRRAVAQLTEFGRAVERTAHPERRP